MGWSWKVWDVMLVGLAEDEGRSHRGAWWKGIPGRGQSECKGPEVRLGRPAQVEQGSRRLWGQRAPQGGHRSQGPFSGKDFGFCW